MQEARRLLEQHPDLSLAEIATRLGYLDYNYFITVFTREVGQSPGAWRPDRQKVHT